MAASGVARVGVLIGVRHEGTVAAFKIVKEVKNFSFSASLTIFILER